MSETTRTSPSRRVQVTAAGCLALACVAAGLLTFRDDPVDGVVQLRPYTESEVAAALPAERPDNCGEVLGISPPDAGERDFEVVEVGLSPATINFIAPKVFLERRIDVVLTVRGERDTYLGLQGRVSLLDPGGRVVAGHPYNEVDTMHAPPLDSGRKAQRAVSLSSCDPTTPGVPPTARYLHIATAGAEQARFVGSVELGQVRP